MSTPGGERRSLTRQRVERGGPDRGLPAAERWVWDKHGRHPGSTEPCGRSHRDSPRGGGASPSDPPRAPVLRTLAVPQSVVQEGLVHTTGPRTSVCHARCLGNRLLTAAAARPPGAPGLSISRGAVSGQQRPVSAPLSSLSPPVPPDPGEPPASRHGSRGHGTEVSARAGVNARRRPAGTLREVIAQAPPNWAFHHRLFRCGCQSPLRRDGGSF